MCVTLHENCTWRCCFWTAWILPGTPPAPAGLGLTAGLELHSLFHTGLPPLHSPEGARLAPTSIHWLRITVVSIWGLQGLLDHVRLLSCSYWHRALYLSTGCLLCCILAALNPKRSATSSTTDYSEICGAATTLPL